MFIIYEFLFMIDNGKKKNIGNSKKSSQMITYDLWTLRSFASVLGITIFSRLNL